MRKIKILSIITSLLVLSCVNSSCQRVLPPHSQETEVSTPESPGNSVESSLPNISSTSTSSKNSRSESQDGTENSTSLNPDTTSNDNSDNTTTVESKLENTLSTKKLTPAEIKNHKKSEDGSYGERLLNSILGLDKDKNKDKEGSMHKPHKVGEAAYFDGSDTLFDPFKAEVKIQEIYRGDSALKMIKDASMFNPEPEKDKEYLVAQVLVKVTASKNQEVVGLSPYYFSLANGNDGRMYGDVTLIRNITPVLSPIEEGQTSIAYICFSVDKKDKNPYIVFLSRANGGIWFQTTKETSEETTKGTIKETAEIPGK